MKYFTSLGKGYKDYVEATLRLNKDLYSTEEFEPLSKVTVVLIQKSEKIDPILETQGWMMENSSDDPLPSYVIEVRPYNSYLLSSLVKPNLPATPKSREY